MGPQLIVILAEGFDEASGMAQVREEVFVQALVAELAIEAFDISVLRRFTWADKTVPDVVLVAPALEGDAGKLRAVVGQKSGRAAAELDEVIEDPSHSDAGERGIGFDPGAFPGVVVDHRQHAERSPIFHPVMNKVHAPALIGRRGRSRALGPSVQPLFSPPPELHLQALGLVHPVDPFVVIGKALPAQKDREPAITPPSPRLRMAAQRFAQWQLRPAVRRPIAVGRDGQIQEPTSPSFTHRVAHSEVIHGGASSRGLYQFFEFTSFSIRISSICSATTFFSSPFSRSSAFSRWS